MAAPGAGLLVGRRAAGVAGGGFAGRVLSGIGGGGSGRALSGGGGGGGGGAAPAARLVFLGPPGVGKGTYAKRVALSLGVEHVAAGDLVRAEVARGTALGREVEAVVRRGALVPDALVTDLVGTRLRALGPGGFILDGFPRTAAQAGALEGLREVHLAVNLRMREEALIMKCLGRRSCTHCGSDYNLADVRVEPSGDRPGVFMPPLPAPPECVPHLKAREDDTLEVVRERLEVHKLESRPVESFYRERGLLMDFEITQGIPETEPVLFKEIQSALQAGNGVKGPKSQLAAA